MKAEEIALAKVRDNFIAYCRDTGRDPESSTGKHLLECFEIGAKLTVQAFRSAGLLLEWRTDVENAPDGTNNVVILHDGAHTTKGRCLMTEGRLHMTNTVWETVENNSYGEVFTMEPTHFAIIKPPEQTNEG